MNDLRDSVRNAAAAQIFNIMASDEKNKEALGLAKTLSDAQLDAMANICGIPEKQKPIYRAFMRGQDNELIEKLNAFEHKLDPGDVILMTGTSKRSSILANSQKTVYSKARSSHVALVHADFICIDAITTVRSIS